jgi:hypothetical protein
VGGGEPGDVEGGDQVEVDDLAEGVQVVRAGLAEGALGDAAAGGGDDGVQAAEVGDGGGDGMFGAGEVGDVEGVERAAEVLGDLVAAGRSSTATLAPPAASRSAVARPMPDAPPTTIAFLPLISMLPPSAGEHRPSLPS